MISSVKSGGVTTAKSSHEATKEPRGKNEPTRQPWRSPRAGAGGTRLAIRDREFIIRQADGRAETKPVESPKQLLALCAQHFGLSFPPGTRFGPPGSPWPS